MISKIEGTEHGYKLGERVTKAEWEAVLAKHKPIRTIILNATTSWRLSLGYSFTVNNTIPDDTFYVNNVW